MNQKRQERKKEKRLKKNALVVCHDGSEFWTTQKQFWQWVRERVILKTSDGPLAGRFVRENQEKLVIIANVVLDLSCPNHLREVLLQRQLARSRQ